MPRHRPATEIREADRRWFTYTATVLRSFAPTLAAQFIATFEAGRRRHDRASYFAVLADLLAEASHWSRATPERSTDHTRRDVGNA